MDKDDVLFALVLIGFPAIIILTGISMHYNLRAKQVARASELQLRQESCVVASDKGESSVHWCYENIK